MAKAEREPEEYVSVMMAHLASLERLSEKRNVSALRKAHAKTLRLLLARLTALQRSRGSPSKVITGFEAQSAIALIRDFMPEMATILLKVLTSGTKDAQASGLRIIIASIEKLTKDLAKDDIALGTSQPMRFDSVLEKRDLPLSLSSTEAIQTYVVQTAEDLSRQVMLAVALGDSFGDAIQRAGEVMEGSLWKTDRIARTQSAYAFNASLYDGIADGSKDVQGLGMRWTELVSDASGQPMDSRVAADSLALHAQIADANGIFTMPEDPRVRPTMWGETYLFPPNRPNDRSCLMPWHPTWGVPGYRYVNGRTVGIAKDGRLGGRLPLNLNPSILPALEKRKR